MTFWRRLRTYLVGVGLGLIMVYVIFGDRELNTWTPQKRILTAIDSSDVTISERAICQLACLDFADTTWKEIQRMAEVNFSESNTDKKPCPIYHLESKWKAEDYLLIWKVCESDEKVELLGISKEGKKCAC